MKNETLQVLEGRMGEFLYNLRVVKTFLTMTWNPLTIKEKMKEIKISHGKQQHP